MGERRSDPGGDAARATAAGALSPWRHAGALLLLIAGAAIGAVTGMLREGSVPTALLLYAEPLPAVLGVCAVHLMFLTGRWTHGLCTALGLTSFLLLSRAVPPIALPAPASELELDTAALGACAARAQPPDAWILAIWSGADDAETLAGLQDVADVLVLLHPRVALPEPAEPIGASTTLPGDAVVWSRAGFAACGAEDTWALGRRSAVVFVAPTPSSSVPLLVTTLPKLGPELDREVADLGALGAILGDRAVIAGEGSFPTSFRRTDQRLADAGLRALRLPPNAPSALGALPLLPLRAVDRVWTGPGWEGRGEVLESGSALIAPVVLRLDTPLGL